MNTEAFEAGILANHRGERIDHTRLNDYDVSFLDGFFRASRGEFDGE